MRRLAAKHGLAMIGVLVLGVVGVSLEAHGQEPLAAGRDPARVAEEAVIAAHPELIRRNGRSLQVGPWTYTDSADCESGEDCLVHYVDAVWNGRHVGILVHSYEDQEYMLVTDGKETLLGDRPIPSPSGSRFFAGWHDDRDWTPHHGASVWEWEPLPQRLRIVDTAIVMFDSFVAWHGEGCVEFTGARGYGKGLQSIRSFWLAEQSDDWALLETRPASCMPASAAP